jgi:hypothetical protein
MESINVESFLTNDIYEGYFASLTFTPKNIDSHLWGEKPKSLEPFNARVYVAFNGHYVNYEHYDGDITISLMETVEGDVDGAYVSVFSDEGKFEIYCDPSEEWLRCNWSKVLNEFIEKLNILGTVSNFQKL